MNFHGVRTFTMDTAVYVDFCTIDFTVHGETGHDHRLVSFVSTDEFPHFARAVKAFNEALKDFVPRQLPDEEPTPINEEMPF